MISEYKIKEMCPFLYLNLTNNPTPSPPLQQVATPKSTADHLSFLKTVSIKPQLSIYFFTSPDS
ncbi:hypothetical protein Leryth_023511, partial [Lithospermum erythrorhizon]